MTIGEVGTNAAWVDAAADAPIKQERLIRMALILRQVAFLIVGYVL